MRILFIMLFLSLTFSLVAQQDSSYRNYLRFTFEDDYLKPFWRHRGSIDRYYTSGLKLEYYTASAKKQWIEKWMPFSRQHTGKSVSYATGCNMYTPAKLYLSNVDSNDRPYAGWIYASTRGIYNNTQGHPHRITVDYSLGVLGPYSLQEQLQKGVHKIIDAEILSYTPRGWHNQIGSALALNTNLRYERALWHSRNLDSMVQLQMPTFECFPFFEVNAGSVMDYVKMGFAFTFQTGGEPSYFKNEIPFLTVFPTIVSRAMNKRGSGKKAITLNFYVSPSVSLVGYNATLSGGLIPFKHSPYTLTAERVKRILGQVDAAIMLKIKRVGLLYTSTYRTVEFKGAGALPSFWAALSLYLFWNHS